MKGCTMKKHKSLLRTIGIVILLLVCLFVFPLGIPFVALALARSRIRQDVNGGGILKAREIYPTASDVWLDLGYLGGTDLGDEHSVIKWIDEAGNVINAQSGQREAGIKSILQQSGIDEINLLKNARGKYYDVYYYKKNLETGTIQEISAAICKLKPGPVLSMKSNSQRTLALEIYFLAPKAAFTRTPAGFNVVADEPYVIAEQASVALGAPTDTAATMAATIL
jgi:hypothetical protein